MLKKLCNACGVSGFVEKVNKLILDEITPFCDKIEIMKDGNIIAYKKGLNRRKKRLMVSAHTDEIGFIVKDITDEGFIRFEEIGGTDKRILLSKKVLIGDSKIPGIIGIKAVHMVKKDEREKTVDIENMYIDIGASSKEDALKYINYGDQIAFDSDFIKLSENRVKAKALDNRVGVSLLIDLIKNNCNYDFIACFNSLEEIGLKGAVTAANKISPDIAIILEGTTCSDVSDTKPHLQSTKLGDGPAISIYDRTSYSNKELNSILFRIADESNIKYQIKRTNAGGNDAGAVSLSGMGVKTAVISIPVRYIHSPVSIMDINDYNEGSKLALKFINTEV